MKLIEKKCPNCGGSLEFSETAKSCKCEYCHRAFEIERNESTSVSDIAEQFNLSELEVPVKTFTKMFAGSYIVFTILSIIVFVGIFAIVITSFNSHRKSIEESFNSETSSTIASNISDFSNTTLKEFSDDSYGELYVKGEHSNTYAYQLEDHEVYKYILAYKDKKNYLYVVQKALYINFFDTNDKTTAFVPIKYENVTTKLDEFSDESEDILNGKTVDADTLYLNSTNSSYIRGGYKDYNKFVEEKINPLKEQGYTITEK